MSISLIELLIVVAVALLAFGFLLAQSRLARFVAGLSVCTSLAAALTPADPLSLVAVAAPYSVAFLALEYWHQRRLATR